MNLSMTFIIFSVTSAGTCASSTSAYVSSGNVFHVDYAVFLLCTTNPDTVSQPVRAWNIRRASDFCGT